VAQGGGGGAGAGGEDDGSAGSSPSDAGASEGGGAGAGAACPVDDVPGTRAAYDRELAAAADASGLDFFAFPWPELSRPISELGAFPNPATATGCSSNVTDPTLALLFQGVDPLEYRAYVSELVASYGAAGPNNAAVYFSFDGALDPADLPTAAESLDASSPVLLVNLEGSAARGRLVPVASRIFTDSRYVPANTLAILPQPGFPLEPGALYAAIVRRSLGDADDQPLGSSDEFERLKLTGNCLPDEIVYAEAFEWLEMELELPREDVAAMTIFRAGEPTAELGSVIAALDTVEEPAGLAGLEVDVVSHDADGGYYLLTGSFATPNHQLGTPPYLPHIDIGFDGSVHVDFAVSEAGSFVAQSPGTERIEFALSIPESLVGVGSELADVPLVVYGPGTGGSRNSPFDDGTAAALAGLGVATFATDPLMHAQRAHSENIDPELIAMLELYDSATNSNAKETLIALVESGDLFFNPLDLQAARGNSLQAAVDYAWQARLLGEVAIEADLDGASRTIRFDAERRYFFGHSQGAASGPLLASSASYAALVLSAPSGHLPSNLLGKTKPAGSLGVAQMLDSIVCDAPAQELDVFHPFLNLLLHWFEPADAVNYAPLLIGESESPKHLFVTSGEDDHYVPRAAHDAVTTAARLQQLSPELANVPGQALLDLLQPSDGHGATSASLGGNIEVEGALVTGAFRQYHDASCSDDHFVATCNATARADWLRFIETALVADHPTVP
jgi:hypothetical protein